MDKAAKDLLESNIYLTFKEFRRLIVLNENKIPKHYQDMYTNFDKAYYYSQPQFRYITLFNNFGKFINKYDIDIDYIKNPILNEINKERRINALKKIDFSDEEDNTYEEDNKNEEEDNSYEEDNKSEEEDNTYEEDNKSEEEDNTYEKNNNHNTY